MTLVSKYKLRPEVWNKVFNLFTTSLSSIKNKNNFEVFLNDFLSPTEKIILAKRFAIAVLLAKGNKYEQIKSLLHVTSATISKVSMSLKYNDKGINETIKVTLKKDVSKIIWDEIKSVFDIPIKGLPISEYHKKTRDREKTIQNLKYGI